MRKKVFGRQLSRSSTTRRALRRSLVRAVVLNGSISTTRAKAKAVQRDVEKLLSLVSKGGVSAQRIARKKMGNDRETVTKLFADFDEHVSSRKSGFTRIVALPSRKGDNAELARLEIIAPTVKEEKAVKKKS